MDEVVTECVYQALVDYNEVGNVDVVGFYYSDVILDAISKGIISSAIALDMDEVGRYSVNALEEYLSLGHTSSYYSVGQHVITREQCQYIQNGGGINERKKRKLIRSGIYSDKTKPCNGSGNVVCGLH